MGRLIENGVKIIIGLIILSIALSLVVHLFSFAIRLAIIGAIGYGGYIGAKKIGLIK